MTSSSDAPSALRMASMLSIALFVCSSIVSPTIFPSGLIGPVPVTKMKSPACQPCEYAPRGTAPSSDWITYFAMCLLSSSLDTGALRRVHPLLNERRHVGHQIEHPLEVVVRGG